MSTLEEKYQLALWKVDGVKYALYGLDNVKKYFPPDIQAAQCISMMEEISDVVYQDDARKQKWAMEDRERRYEAIKWKMEALQASTCLSKLKTAQPEKVSKEELIKILNTIHEIFREDFGFK